MTRKFCFNLLFFLCISFVFIKIYQHNLIIKLLYKKQRLKIKEELLKQNKKNMLTKIYNLQDFTRIKSLAQEKLGLKELKLSQIVTLTK